MKLFQYWDTGQPPDEVAGWIEGFRANNPDLRHRLYNRGSAGHLILKQLGERHRRAFDACAVPAMQADYFRLCALYAKAGVYVDADFQSLAPLSGLLDQAPRSLMLVWRERVNTGLMMFRRRRDAVVGACLELATRNIEARHPGRVWLITGPALPNIVRALVDPDWAQRSEPPRRNIGNYLEPARAIVEVSPALIASVRSMTMLHTLAVETWIGTLAPAYKTTAAHWTNWQGSIYQEPGPPATP